MKRIILLISIFIFVGTLSYGAFVTALMDGTIKYLPEEGQTIKQGELLIKLSDVCINLQIKAAEIEIKIQKEELKDLKTDIVRAKKLHEKSAVSLATLENTVFNYEKCKYELIKLNLDYKILERKLNKCELKAPFDCIVTKVLIIPNSGVELGQEILEVEKVK